MIAQLTTALLAFASLAGARPGRQYGPVNHDVVVGGPGILRYTPAFVEAKPGDTITFTFMQKNHTVTQSSLASPCSPFPDGGFDSGFVPVPDSNTAGPFPTARLTVRNYNPIWVYCRQANHCQQGMVFAVNPGDKLAQFQQNAAASSTQASQTTPSSGTSLSVSNPSPTPSPVVYASTPTDHRVIVGGPNLLLYTPSNITAQPGDTVTFEFRVKNHTVTQSAFGTPCRPLADTAGKIGFDSGFMPVAADATVFPTYTVKINDTAPVWAYCRQTSHCGMGMVFSVNADEKSANTFEAFRANAIKQNGTAPATGSA